MTARWHDPSRFAWVLALTVAGGGCGEARDTQLPAPEQATPPAERQPVVRMPVQHISDDLLVLSGFSNGNVLAIRRDSTLVLVDAQSENRVDELAETLTASGFTEPVRMVINTHYHTDHVGGNTHWRAEGSEVLAHPSVVTEMAKDTFIVEMSWRRTPEPAEVHPTATVADSLDVGTADFPIIVRHLPAAHTGGDLAVWLPRADLLHMGDIVEIGADPLVDRWAGGTLEGMIAAVRWALSVVGPSTVVVPGHGPPIDRERLGEYLATLESRQEEIPG